MKMIFGIVIAFVALTQSVNAKCVDANGNTYTPIAVTDANGKVDVKAKTGETVHVSRLPVYKEVCGNFLFESLIEKCATPDIHLEGDRDAKFCEGDQSAGGCKHFVCDVARKTVSSGPKKRR